MKRSLAYLILVCGVVVGLIAGCGSGEDNAADDVYHAAPPEDVSGNWILIGVMDADAMYMKLQHVEEQVTGRLTGHDGRTIADLTGTITHTNAYFTLADPDLPSLTVTMSGTARNTSMNGTWDAANPSYGFYDNGTWEAIKY